MKNIQCLECGTITTVEDILPGQTVNCVSCGKTLITRSPNDTTGNTNLCSYCGTEIGDGDTCIFCPECSMGYHAECWEENEGCATYGCLRGKEDTPKILPEAAATFQANSNGIPMPSGVPMTQAHSGQFAEIMQKILFVILYTAGAMLTFGAIGVLLLAFSLCLFILGMLVLFTVSFFFLWGENSAWYVWLGSLIATLGYLFLGYCILAKKEKVFKTIKNLGKRIRNIRITFKELQTDDLSEEI